MHAQCQSDDGIGKQSGERRATALVAMKSLALSIDSDSCRSGHSAVPRKFPVNSKRKSWDGHAAGT
jgi:hypothetical protein